MDVGFASALLGDLEVGERVLRKGHEVLASAGDTGARCTIDAMLADVLFRQGRLEEARSFAEESSAITALDDLDAQPRWRAALARIASAQGAQAEAEQLAREAVVLVDPIDLLLVKALVFDALGEVLARGGKVGESASAYERAIAVHEQKGNVVSAARTRTVLDELRAARPS